MLERCPRRERPRWERLAVLLSQDASLREKVLPEAELVRVCAPTGQLIIHRGVVVSFYLGSSNPRVGETTILLEVVEALIERALAISSPPPRKAERLPRKNKALAGGATWSWRELKGLLGSCGEISRAEALGLLTMSGREASEARMEASFTAWLLDLAKEGKVELDEWDVIRPPR